MKNLNALDEDQLDNLPSRSKKRDGDRYHYGTDYPYRRVWRFLESRVGQPWDHVVSEFVHADWVPAHRRVASELSRDVSIHTFLKDGEVYYYHKYGFYGCSEHPIKSATRKTLYVHPTTRILCAFIPNKKPTWETVRRREKAKYMRVIGDYHQLLKLEGIWYEVKAEVKKPDVVEIDGLHYRILHTIPSPGENYKIVDGKILSPVVHNERYRGLDIGPRDQLIETPNSADERYYWKRPNYDSIKIVSCRQLNHKSLKKHGLHNDAPEFGARCKQCGMENCKQAHNRRCSTCGERWCKKHG